MASCQGPVLLDTIHRKANIFLTSCSPQRPVWPQVAVAHGLVTGSPPPPPSVRAWKAVVTCKSQFSQTLGDPPHHHLHSLLPGPVPKSHL